MLPQLDRKSLLGCLCNDFYLAIVAELAVLFILKFFVLVCCLSAQKVFFLPAVSVVLIS